MSSSQQLVHDAARRASGLPGQEGLVLLLDNWTAHFLKMLGTVQTFPIDFHTPQDKGSNNYEDSVDSLRLSQEEAVS